MEVDNYIDGNKFKQLADLYVDKEKPFVNLEEFNNPQIVFIKGDWITPFKEKILPRINNKFKLITHNADTANPLPHQDLLEDDRVIHWYGMNANIQHSKFTSIPIGIANDEWPHGNKELLHSKRNNVKDRLVYCNFDFNTNRYRYEVHEQIKNKEFIDFDFTKNQPGDYWNLLSQYKYVISPPGNSVDCHRVWEAIYLGVIPIIEKDKAMEYFYDLPIMVIDDWSSLSIDFLEKQTIINNNDKASFSYYKDLII